MALTSVAAVAQDRPSTIITINGGKTVVNMKATSTAASGRIEPAVNPFYDNIGYMYLPDMGWTLSNDLQQFVGDQFVSLKSGTTKKIGVGLGYLDGTDSAYITLDKDCNGVPCGTIDKTKLCRGTVSGTPTFGSARTAVTSFRCKAKLQKGKPYWVYIESFDNSDLVWNYSNGYSGWVIGGIDGVWQSPANGQPLGALRVD
jgi:hypothetical protein